MVLPSMGTVAQADKKEIVVGAGLPLSGPAAPWGVPIQNTWAMLADQINEAGGFTVKDQQYFWKFIAYDDELTPSKAVDVVNRLLTRDKAQYVYTFGTDATLATIPLTEPAKVINISLSPPNKDLINPKNYYTFTYGMDAMTALVFYPWLAENRPDVTKVALFHEDTINGLATAEMDRAGIKGTRLKIVFDEFGDPAATDFNPVLTRMLATKPDFLAIENWAPDINALMIKQARELGFTGDIHLITPDLPTLKEIAGVKNIDGVYCDPEPIKWTAGMQKFKDDYIARFGEKEWPGANIMQLRDGIFWITEAIKATQSFDNEKIVAWMEKAEMKSLFGEPAFLGGSSLFGIARIPIWPSHVSVLKNGEFVEAYSGLVDMERTK
jgi:branched-chain amino acid transport system substrate-binding protein